MIQDQLVDYISSQMKIGVPRDSIKTTLLAAGWQAADVEDTLSKVESSKTSQPITSGPAGPAIGPKPVAPSSAMKTEPQVMKVSDLISASDPAMSVKPVAAARDTSKKSPMIGPTTTAGTMTATQLSGNQKEFPPKDHSSRKPLIIEGVLGLVVVILAVFAGFLYFQNGGLTTKLNSLTADSANVTSQLSALQQQVSASTTLLTVQVGELNAKNQDLQTELSFYAVPPGAAAGATSTAMLTGTLSGGDKVPYTITTSYGTKIYVANSKDPGIIAAFTPIGTSTAQFAGMFVLGSDSITITSVNSTTVQ
jgi:hypothetical protein